MEKILLTQFIAHLVADFFAQPECVSRKKQEYIFRSWHIYVHVLIVFAVSAAMMPVSGFILWAGIIALLHFGIDAARCAIGRVTVNNRSRQTLFFADQILHFAVIRVAVLLYMKTGGTVPEFYGSALFTTHNLLLTAGLLLCLKPANVLIQICFQSLKTDNKAIEASLGNDGLQRAGHWIGSIERMLVFVLLLLGEYTAIGFIIAAKSVLRYNKTDEAEYVLVGTLISFAVAFALGVGISSGIFENVINIIACKI